MTEGRPHIEIPYLQSFDLVLCLREAFKNYLHKTYEVIFFVCFFDSLVDLTLGTSMAKQVDYRRTVRIILKF